MATYHHSIKSGKKGTAFSHAAYITRKGKHQKRKDLILSGFGNMPDWAEKRPDVFWKTGDKYERANGAVYREHEIALPKELNLEEQRELVDDLVAEIAGDKPYQYAVHAPQSAIGKKTNTHIHLMLSDRVPDGITRTPDQEFSRFNRMHPESGGRRKDSGGNSPRELKEKTIQMRKASADLLNAALERHGYETRVDHRSLKEQGLTRAPERHYGPARIQAMSDQEKARITQRREEASASSPTRSLIEKTIWINLNGYQAHLETHHYRSSDEPCHPSQ